MRRVAILDYHFKWPI